MRRTDLEKGEGLTQKNGKIWLGKVGSTDWKSAMDWPKKWEGLTLNMEGLNQNREDPIRKQKVWLEKRRSCWHLTDIVIYQQVNDHFYINNKSWKFIAFLAFKLLSRKEFA